MKWERRFVELARHVALWSRDRSTKVGAVIVGPDREIRSVGYNGFPRSVDDEVEFRHERPAKYLFTEHAERNAAYNAARVGIPLKGCTAYVSLYPCADCARALIQVGIKRIVVGSKDDPRGTWGTWGESFVAAEAMLADAGVEVVFVPPDAPEVL